MRRNLVARALRGSRAEAQIWWVAMAIMAGFAAFSAGLYFAVDSAYDARLDRDAARMPVTEPRTVDSAPWEPDDPRVWVRFQSASVAFEAVQVLSFIVPPETLATPPPGLDRWPGPGEVFASPYLLAIPGGESFVSGYGEVAGSVAQDALADPRDRVLYVGVDPSLVREPASFAPVESYGAQVGLSGDTGLLGTTLYQADREVFWIGLTVFALAPSLLLTGVSLRLGGDRRDSVILILRSLGASRGRVTGTVARTIGPPIVLGSSGGFAVLALAATMDFTIPHVRYPLTGADLTAGLPGAGLAAVTVAAFLLAAGVLMHRPGRSRSSGTALVSVVGRPRSFPLWAGLVAVLVANWGYAMFYRTDPDIALMIRLLAAAVIVTLLGAMIAPILAILARWLVAAARLGGSAAMLVAGRDISRFTKATVRLTAMASMLIVLGIQFQVLMSEGSGIVRQATAQIEQDAGRVLMTDDLSGDLSWVSALAARGNDNYGVLVLTGDRSQAALQEVELYGACDDLLAAVVQCPDRVATIGELQLVREELRSYGVDSQTSVVRDDDLSGVDDEPLMVLYVSRHDAGLDSSMIRSDLREIIQPVPSVEPIGAGWAVGAYEGARHTAWLVPGMAIASGMALTVALSSALVELIRSAQRIRPLLTIADRRTIAVFAACAVGIPLLLSVLMGIIIGLSLVIAPTHAPGTHADVTFQSHLLLLSVGVLAAAVGTFAAYRVLSRLSQAKAGATR